MTDSHSVGVALALPTTVAEGAGDKVVHALEQPLKLSVNDAVEHAELRALRDAAKEALTAREPLPHAVGE